MSHAHAPNGLLVDPIYAKMRCKPLCLVPTEPPAFEPPIFPPQSTVNQPPTAPSAFNTNGNLVQDNLPPEAMAVGTDGAIDVFLMVAQDGEPACPLSELGRVELNVAEADLPTLSVVVGVAMHSYEDRILVNYSPMLAMPGGVELALTDRSGQGQQYDWVGESLTIEGNTTNGPNGTTVQTRVYGRDNVEGRWFLYAGRGVNTQLDVAVVGWGDFNFDDLMGVVGTGGTAFVNGELQISGPIPEEFTGANSTAYLKGRCGSESTVTMVYDEDRDMLIGTLPEDFTPDQKFMELQGLAR